MNARSEISFGIVPLMCTKQKWRLFVILHKSGKYWGFPKGKPNFDETPMQTACRELLEETGFKVEHFLAQEPITEHYSFYKKETHISKVVHYYPAIVSGICQLCKKEIYDGCWVTFKEASELLTFQESKTICSHVKKLVESL